MIAIDLLHPKEVGHYADGIALFFVHVPNKYAFHEVRVRGYEGATGTHHYTRRKVGFSNWIDNGIKPEAK